jgi:hypothetical protein
MVRQETTGRAALQVNHEDGPGARIGYVGSVSGWVNADIIEIAVMRRCKIVKGYDMLDPVGRQVYLDQLRTTPDNAREGRRRRIENPEKIVSVDVYALNRDEMVFGMTVLPRSSPVPGSIGVGPERTIGRYFCNRIMRISLPAGETDENPSFAGYGYASHLIV